MKGDSESSSRCGYTSCKSLLLTTDAVASSGVRTPHRPSRRCSVVGSGGRSCSSLSSSQEDPPHKPPAGPAKPRPQTLNPKSESETVGSPERRQRELQPRRAAAAQMASYFTPSPILDAETLVDVTAKCLLLQQPPSSVKEAAGAHVIWEALNRVYPAWFDQSVHPKECGSPQVRRRLQTLNPKP